MDDFELRRARSFAQRRTCWTAATAILGFILVRWGIAAQPYPYLANLFVAVAAGIAFISSIGLGLAAVRAWRCVRSKAVWVFEGSSAELGSGSEAPELSDDWVSTEFGSVIRAEVWAPGFIPADRGRPTWGRARPVRTAIGDGSFIGERRLSRQERRELLGHIFAMCLSSVWALSIGAYAHWSAFSRDSAASRLLIALACILVVSIYLRTSFFAVDWARGICRRPLGSETVRLPVSGAAWMADKRPAAWRVRTKPTLDPPINLIRRVFDRQIREAISHRGSSS